MAFLRDNVTILNNALVSILDILESIPDLKLPEVRIYILKCTYSRGYNYFLGIDNFEK